MEALNQIQPMPIIVSPREERFNEDIYEASNGNLINSKDGGLALTPQGETNLDSKKEQNAAEAEAQSQAQKDQTRANATDYLAHKSMQSQVEIYLAVATNGKVDIGSDSTSSIIGSLRDVQKQNSVVEAYATYEENQKSVISQ